MSDAIINALKGVDPADAMPFGAANTPEGSPTMFGNMVSGLMGMPKRLIDAAKTQDTEAMIPASTETAMALAGVGAPAAEAGAAGIFGGKLGASPVGIQKMEQAMRMTDKAQSPEMIRQITGWHQGPDGKFRFEIPDERARMMYPDGVGPAGTMFQHNDLYKAYPSLRDVKMYSEVNPNFKGDTGGWNPSTGLMEMSSRNPYQAKLGALHEMQHAVQHIEGFTPGSTVSAFEDVLKTAPPELRARAEAELGGKVDPYDLYHRTGGEVESRNVETRSGFTPQQRHEISPWQTQDVPTHKQLMVRPLTEVDHPELAQFLKALRGQ